MIESSRPRRFVCGAAAAVAAVLMSNGAAAREPQPNWPEVKCGRYAAAWTEALRRKRPQGLSIDFVERHDAFIARGCRESTHVCPRSAEELAMANVMVVAALNAGMASTFPPFACRK
ncbi:MAG TPA: hypothetical protein VGU45_08035 [Microvirga sp.]|jgi:hypothetical protein|nr:hypothetical protein [Microvirga sp.]